MLVLSRGPKDKFNFPTLGITVEILRVAGRNVRIGIVAPKEIPVLRDEIMPRTDAIPPPNGAVPSSSGQVSHATRNRLQNATLGLRLLQKMLDAGQADELEPILFKIFNELKTLEEELTPSTGPPGRPSDGTKGRRALIVEDDPNESKLLAGYLRLSGFEVSTAIDGMQAISRLSKDDLPDIVLLDMVMPQFDGHKTVSAIRQNSELQTLKIFAVTGIDHAESTVDIGPGGVDRWFRKPVDPERLVDAIHDELAAEVATV